MNREAVAAVADVVGAVLVIVSLIDSSTSFTDMVPFFQPGPE